MLTIKLSSSNYLLWKKSSLSSPISQHLLGYVDGSISETPTTIFGGKNSILQNPAHAVWLEANQRVHQLLNSSLTEEAMVKSLGHENARQL